jgi:hypothetical protein
MATNTKATILPADWGLGWMSGNARDLIKIMYAFGGLDISAFMAELTAMHKSDKMVNLATVEKVLGILSEKARR